MPRIHAAAHKRENLLPFTAFAEKLVLEALFSIALGFQPKVRILKTARRGATFCGSFKGNRATLTGTRQMAKTQIVAPRHSYRGDVRPRVETLGCHNLSLRDIQSPP